MSLRSVVAAVVLAVGAASPAVALPADQTVVYTMRETPGQSGSAMVFRVTMHLKAVSAEGDSVGWSATEVEFHQPSDGRWIETAPVFETSDGLWWVDHFDPESPIIDEFSSPPLIQGRATAQAPSTVDLDYWFVSAGSNSSLAASSLAATTLIDYTFTAAGSSEPTAEGDDEPVDIDNGNPPP